MSLSWSPKGLNELPEVRFEFPNLRNRRLEVVGTRKNVRARRRHARGEEACSLARARSLFRSQLPSACYACYEFPFILIGKLTMDFFSKPIMARTQILVHRWGPQNKDFGAVLQTDLTRVKFRLCSRLRSLCHPVFDRSVKRI